jgi:hypothetical protein
MLSQPWTWRPVADWTAEDMGGLNSYLGSSSGQKFIARLRNASVQASANAVAGDSAHRNGTAYGLIVAIQFIESLSRQAAPHDGNNTGDAADKGAGANLEHLAP